MGPTTRSSVARPLSPTTAIPPFTPPPRRHVIRINVTPHTSGGTSEPGINALPTLAFAFANPNYYEPINDGIIDEPPPGGELHMSSQHSPGTSPSLLTPPSPRAEHNTDENPPLEPLSLSTMTAIFHEGFATAPTMTAALWDGFAPAHDFLAPADFGTTTSDATTTTRVLESSPTTLTDLDRILAAIGGINARFDNQHADINARFDGVTARFDALGDRLQAFESLGPHLDALDEHVWTTDDCVTTTNKVLSDLDKCITTTTDLINDATTRLDAQMKKVDEVATVKLIEYGRRVVDYGSRLGHFTNTDLPKLRSDLAAFATRVTNIQSRPPNTTTQDVQRSDASSTASVASVADDALDHLRPPTVDNDRFSTTGCSPHFEDERL